MEIGKGLNKHAASKKHMLCESMWKDKGMRIATGREVSTLVNAEQLQRNRYYLSSIVDVLEFLAVSHLPFRGDNDSYASMSDDGCGLFLSLFEYTLRKDPVLATIAQSIPHNARYTSHEIQNELLDIMSTMVTKHIITEVGE